MVKPNIIILATGGTIAGVIDSDTKTTGYKAGVLSINTLVDNIGNIKDIVNIRCEQIANIDSSDITNDILLHLANYINSLLNKDDVDGIVVAHGTDTIEESAYFLNLTVKSNKPVVLVGAMRPSTAISADGPMNLYNAIILASSKKAYNMGVMVLVNDRIHSARYISKVHTLNVDAFKSLNVGDMGYIIDGDVFFNYIPIKSHTINSIFNIKNIKDLPKVDILYSYSSDGCNIASKALFDSGTKGLVIVGSGSGSIHKYNKGTLKELINKGLIIVVSSRVEEGSIVLNDIDCKSGFISSNNLNPQKARILLMLALSKYQNSNLISDVFNKY